jgi:methionyl-tRNA formyltransferase
MKALVICSSDVLGMPAIIRLQQQNRLHGVAIPEKAKHVLIPTLKQFGIADADIHILTKADYGIQLTTLIQEYKAQALLTFTFGWVIPADVLATLPNRCINFHFGLLPKYKGADPIFWQLYNREVNGGLSVHIMTEAVDEGPIILRQEIPIIPGETYGLHTQRLGQLGAQTVIPILDMLASGTAKTISVTDVPAQYFKKPTQAQLAVNWQQHTAEQIEGLVNATNPRYGGAVTSIRQMEVRVLEVSAVDVNNPSPVAPGTIVYADTTYGLIVACLNQRYLKINVVSIREGFISGTKLFALGCQLGDVFV